VQSVSPDMLWNLMDVEESTCYQLWGGIYTWMLLREWSRCQTEASKIQHPPAFNYVAKLIPGIVGAEVLSISFYPSHLYEKAKREGR